jgi:hypothetical protein
MVRTLLAPSKADVFPDFGCGKADCLLDLIELRDDVGRIDDGDLRRGGCRG